MIRAWCYDLQNQQYFIKEFYYEKQFKTFYNKCKYSNKIKIIAKEIVEL